MVDLDCCKTMLRYNRFMPASESEELSENDVIKWQVLGWIIVLLNVGSFVMVKSGYRFKDFVVWWVTLAFFIIGCLAYLFLNYKNGRSVKIDKIFAPYIVGVFVYGGIFILVLLPTIFSLLD